MKSPCLYPGVPSLPGRWARGHPAAGPQHAPDPLRSDSWPEPGSQMQGRGHLRRPLVHPSPLPSPSKKQNCISAERRREGEEGVERMKEREGNEGRGEREKRGPRRQRRCREVTKVETKHRPEGRTTSETQRETDRQEPERDRDLDKNQKHIVRERSGREDLGQLERGRLSVIIALGMRESENQPSQASKTTWPPAPRPRHCPDAAHSPSFLPSQGWGCTLSPGEGRGASPTWGGQGLP